MLEVSRQHEEGPESFALEHIQERPKNWVNAAFKMRFDFQIYLVQRIVDVM